MYTLKRKNGKIIVTVKGREWGFDTLASALMFISIMKEI